MDPEVLDVKDLRALAARLGCPEKDLDLPMAFVRRQSAAYHEWKLEVGRQPSGNGTYIAFVWSSGLRLGAGPDKDEAYAAAWNSVGAS